MTDYSWQANPWVFALTFRRVNEPPNGRPILFSGQMIRAILDDRKNQTRRVIKPQPETISGAIYWRSPNYDNGAGVHYLHTDEEAARRLIVTAYPYKVGSRLWVRETWAPPVFYNGITVRDIPNWVGCWWRADKNRPLSEDELIWRPAIFMPKWASRITLEITDVRVNRLQEISEEDARAEGCEECSITDYDIAEAMENPLDESKAFMVAIGPGTITTLPRRVPRSIGTPQKEAAPNGR